MKSAEEFIERYCGAFPDEHRRPPFKTWQEIRDAMRDDLNKLRQAACKEQREICVAQYDFYANFTDDDVRREIENAPEPNML